MVPVRKTVLIQSKPVRANADVWCESTQRSPVGVGLKLLRKQCTRKERKSKSGNSEGINQKEKSRKRKRIYLAATFIFTKGKRGC